MSESLEPLFSLVPMSYSFFKENEWQMLMDNYQEILGSATLFEPNEEAYLMMEQTGSAIYLALYKKEEVIGYISIACINDLHTQQRLQAQIDAVFIKKPHRSFSAFKFLVTETEELLRVLKVGTVSFSSPEVRPIGKILERFNYSPKETIYMKEL